MKKPDSDRHGYIPGGNPCPVCGKRSWLSKADAKKIARRMTHRDGRLHPYRCTSGAWHLGHTPTVVRAGVLPRHDLAPARRKETR